MKYQDNGREISKEEYDKLLKETNPLTRQISTKGDVKNVITSQVTVTREVNKGLRTEKDRLYAELRTCTLEAREGINKRLTELDSLLTLKGRSEGVINLIMGAWRSEENALKTELCAHLNALILSSSKTPLATALRRLTSHTIPEDGKRAPVVLRLFAVQTHELKSWDSSRGCGTPCNPDRLVSIATYGWGGRPDHTYEGSKGMKVTDKNRLLVQEPQVALTVKEEAKKHKS